VRYIESNLLCAGNSWRHFSAYSTDHRRRRHIDRSFALLFRLIDYATSEFGITDKRVIVKIGFLRRKTFELLLRHVAAISVDQSVMGRLLNYGAVTLTGTGGVKEVFHNISKPLEFRRQIQGEAS
jgi:uncharacterized membrane protein YdbT with pleckstrin-like domain